MTPAASEAISSAASAQGCAVEVLAGTGMIKTVEHGFRRVASELALPYILSHLLRMAVRVR